MYSISILISWFYALEVMIWYLFKLVREATPIQMDWIAFVLVCIAVWVLWVIIIHLSERIVFKFIQENEQASIISFSIFQIFNTFVLKLIISFVPNSFVHWFEWLNHEVILFAFVLNIPLKIWSNIIFKHRKFANFSSTLYILYAEIMVHSTTRYPSSMIKENILSCSHLLLTIIFTFIMVFTKLQYLYGSRFFLPNCFRFK